MKLVYIAGDNRSGSTVLDMMLAGHSQMASLGEAHHLRAYATKDIRYYAQVKGDRAHEMICFCGQPLDSCKFWQGIEKELGTSLGSLDLKLFFLRSDLRNKPLQYIQKKLLWGIFHLYPSVYKTQIIHSLIGGQRVGRDSKRLYEAVAHFTGASYILDSSKSPHRMYSIANEMPENMKVILLCRDFKGNVYSKMKRGVPMFKAALQWKWTVQQMELYCQKLQSKDVIRVKYEDICQQSEQQMRRISDFLELEFEPSMLQRNVVGLHHLGGSPSKYDGRNEKIHLDQSYMEHLTTSQRTWLYRLVRKEASIWGYTR